MSQVSNLAHNEFIFGEKGGRGKNLLSFLRNLSLTGPLLSSSKPDDSEENLRQINSSIYGDMTYGYNSPDTGGLILPRPSMAKGRRLTLQQFFSYGYGKSRDSGLKGDLQGSNDANGAKNASGVSGNGSHVSSRLESPLFRHGTSSMSALDSSLPKSSRKTKFTDLDDDWDAEIEEVDADSSQKTLELSKNLANAASSPMIDLLHPDLMAFDSLLVFSTEKVSPPQQNERILMDSHDMQAKMEVQRINQMQTRLAKFTKVLLQNDGTVNLRDLRKISWNGIPLELRASVWQLLVGYLPANKLRQVSILKRKRSEYVEGLKNASTQILFKDDSVIGLASSLLSSPNPGSLDSNNKENSVNKDKVLYHQIKIDVKRTNPTLPLYSLPATQQSLKKILYLWAVRHPASGYVQGINDLCTPFYQIFLGNYIWQLQRKAAYLAGAADDSMLFIPGLLADGDSEIDIQEQQLLEDPALMTYTAENFDTGLLSERITSIIEADTYWCLSRLLENITDNYIHEQPGILRQVSDLRNLILKIDPELLLHFESEGVEFIQFLFRWMNCLLMREVSVALIIRMWDTYLSETPLGFNLFHVYVCAAFLIKFSAELKEKDFQDILLFLQSPPTTKWTEKDIEVMLSEAFIWQSLYVNAGAHLR